MGDRGLTQGAAIAALRRFVRPAPVEERCELCGVALAPAHRHLLEVAVRNIVCACDPCALRFQDVVAGRFRLIPRDPRTFPDLRISDAQWESLALPIQLAFFFYSTPTGKMTALYPSPAGATESLLPLSAWSALTAENPLLGSLEPDVEALLVNRAGQARDYLIAPIDACFELAGLIRLHWRGLSGGEAVWREITEFFARLRAAAKIMETQNA
jgi:hypothetical protein